MIGAVLIDDPVFRQRKAERLRGLLQGGLVVVKGEVADVDASDVAGEDAADEGSGGWQAPVQVDRSDDRLQSIGEQRQLLSASRPRFARSHSQIAADMERPSLLRERRRRNQMSLDLRERTFLQIGKGAKNQLSDEEAENGVPEELEPLVVGRGCVAPFVRK